MRVLVVKTSSLGDVIHALPALTDAARALPGLEVEWLVEEAFAEIPAWHPAVTRVIPVALRRWRRRPFAVKTRHQWRAFRAALAERGYDRVLDAQGLLKSALLARLAQPTQRPRGERVGYDRHSAREPLAALAYDRRIPVPRGEHAVTRQRRLFAAALGYPLPDTPPDYGLRLEPAADPGRPYLVLLHGTTWPTKHWPVEYWVELARLAAAAGYRIELPWGGEAERRRAETIAAAEPAAEVLPRLGLREIAARLAGAAGVVGVDSGLAHLAAALARPAVTIYGATRADLTGTWGPGQHHAVADFPCAPCLRRECRYRGDSEVWPACYASLPPERVWEQLCRAMG